MAPSAETRPLRESQRCFGEAPDAPDCTSDTVHHPHDDGCSTRAASRSSAMLPVFLRPFAQARRPPRQLTRLGLAVDLVLSPSPVVAGLRSICPPCRVRLLSSNVSSGRKTSRRLRQPLAPRGHTRWLSSTRRRADDQSTKTNNPNRRPEPSPPKDDNIARVPDEVLPSHRERLRWTISVRISELMDKLQEHFAMAGQKVNRYTGTDYSGIEALRREIKEQERLVKARRSAVNEAKDALDAAHSQQGASQKEVVGLLERKHSWSAQDLERYMALVRSEHINDQAVQAAKDRLHAAERALEEARSQLERRERAQYHEEQIWSDTIRRNSTWVTFGLMGVNIFLLLVNLAVIEPWRRRRLVKEVRRALDEKTPMVAAMEAAPQELPITRNEVQEIDAATDSTSTTLEDVEVAQASGIAAETDVKGPAVIWTEDSKAGGDWISPQPPKSRTAREFDRPYLLDTWSSTLDRCKTALRDIVSDQSISIRKVDLTAIAIESAAAGAVLAGVVLILLRPR